jgi:hypothetical protein
MTKRVSQRRAKRLSDEARAALRIEANVPGVNVQDVAQRFGVSERYVQLLGPQREKGEITRPDIEHPVRHVCCIGHCERTPLPGRRVCEGHAVVTRAIALPVGSTLRPLTREALMARRA